MQVDTITRFDDFLALEPNWNDVYRKDDFAQYFLSWRWFYLVFNTYPDEWRVLAVSNRHINGYVCFMPISVTTVWSNNKQSFRNEVQMAGKRFWGQYTGFICDPEWEESAIPCLAAAIKELNWSRLSLRYFYASTNRARLLTKCFDDEEFDTRFHEYHINNGKINNLVCPVIDLPESYEGYLQDRLSANMRQKIRRYTRQVTN